MSSPVLLEAAGGLAHLTLNRPEHLNTIDLDMAEALLDAAQRVAADRSLRAVLLDGAGRTFCAGGDLKTFGDQADLGAYLRAITNRLHAAQSILAGLNAPIVVAVQGAAAGAGLGLACSGDIVLAAETTRFAFAYTALGFTADGGSSWWLPRLVGIRLANEMALTNRVLGAHEAAVAGLVTRVVAGDQLDKEALSVAQGLASGPTRAMGETRRMLWQSPRNSFEEQLAWEGRSLSDAAASPDGREGLSAFLQKRSPDFRG